MNATHLLATYLGLCAAVVLPIASGAGACDDPGQAGSTTITLSGTGHHMFKPGSPNYGTYTSTAKGTRKQQTAIRNACRWRVDSGKQWNKLGKWTHKSSVTIGPATYTQTLDTRNCPRWTMTK